MDLRVQKLSKKHKIQNFVETFKTLKLLTNDVPRINKSKKDMFPTKHIFYKFSLTSISLGGPSCTSQMGSMLFLEAISGHQAPSLHTA